MVDKAIEHSTGKKYAVKAVNKDDAKEIKHMRNEIDLLSDVEHSSIINLHAAYEDQNKLYMIIEQCDGGELYQYVIDRVNTTKNANGNQGQNQRGHHGNYIKKEV
jgi:calcium-dependent protein kinase